MVDKEEESVVVKEEEVKKRRVEPLRFSVVEVATQTEPVIVRGDEQFTVYSALALLLNKVDRLEKGLL